MSNKKILHDYLVKISDDALMEMSLATLEGYVVQQQMGEKGKKAKREVETYGLLWGNEILLPDGNILFSIRKMTVDTMAYKSTDSVTPSKCREIAKDLVTSYWADYSFIGDFHSHPYGHYTEVENIRGYEFSDGDRESMISIRGSDDDYRVGLVMTVASLDRAMNRSPEKISDNIIKWDFNNYRFWLNACIVINNNDFEGEDECNEEEQYECNEEEDNIIILPKSSYWSTEYENNKIGEIMLHCTSLEGPLQATAFGRKIGKGKHELGYV